VSCSQSGTLPIVVTCTVVTMASGQTVTVGITATPEQAATYRNTATIGSPVTSDPVPGNNRATVNTVVSGP
jgi:hypothetical protein